MDNSLRTIHKYRTAAIVTHSDNLLYGVDYPENIGDMGNADNFDLFGQQIS